MLDDLSVLEAKIITALAATAPMGLIGLVVAAATSYSSASVATRGVVATSNRKPPLRTSD
jgi:hypothetical protein